VRELREKLRRAEQRLQGMRQDHSSAYEDLRAANEELQSLNEEYRSTTEELETSKEELQSVNEELQTVNSELKSKLEEASRANNDLENFMTATDIAMLFLDRELAIKRYTPRLADIFNIKPHDGGRPIGDLTHNLLYDDLEHDARRVLADLVPVEREVESRTGSRLVVRVRPYRTSEDRIDGVVITFVD
jgi:two-component system CheB/CheR fusion protein